MLSLLVIIYKFDAQLKAIHNKDYSVVKTFKVAFAGRLFCFIFPFCPIVVYLRATIPTFLRQRISYQ